MFGFYEITGSLQKVRRFEDKAFATVADAIAFLGDKVVDASIDEDGAAGDVFIKSGEVLAIEPCEYLEPDGSPRALEVCGPFEPVIASDAECRAVEAYFGA